MLNICRTPEMMQWWADYLDGIAKGWITGQITWTYGISIGARSERPVLDD